MQLQINGLSVETTDDPATPLLWFLRDELQLTGTKFGCGIGSCGACSVLVDGRARRSCITPIADLAGAKITTIEGLGSDEHPHPLQAAWVDLQVPQCGYCQSGMLIAAAGLLREKPNPTDADIDAAIDNLCRCGTYQRVRAAIHAAALAMRGTK